MGRTENAARRESVRRGWQHPSGPIRVGVSTCLLGEKVRYDGNHKRDSFLVDTLGPFVEWVPVCPEVESGMPVPRPPVRLARSGGALRMVEVDSGADHTRRMLDYSRRRVGELAERDLCGYVLKKASPSCGMERVKVWNAGGQATRDGRGLFASALIEAMDSLPVEEEGRLSDADLRENFVERIFAFRRLKALFSARWTIGDLVDFHTAHKLQLMAHSETAYRTLGPLVAASRSLPRAELQARYMGRFMEALRHRATVRRHTNVMSHMIGHFRGRLDQGSRAELRDVIEDYRRHLVPLIVPITLIRHHARSLEVDYLLRQVYLDPHPKELMLRNHV
jgi:uncharacterized protein YbgA (DUF1722 family)/uncharacterized protein YbbK (DUF523 family)